jgi:hypothetical protein
MRHNALTSVSVLRLSVVFNFVFFELSHSRTLAPSTERSSEVRFDGMPTHYPRQTEGPAQAPTLRAQLDRIEALLARSSAG